MLTPEVLDHYRDAARRLGTAKNEEALNLAAWLGECAKYMISEIDSLSAEKGSSIMFESTSPHYCPKCDPVFSKRGNRINEPLLLTTRNYSGTGTDIAHCRNCDGYFILTYQIKSVEELKDYKAKNLI